MSPTLQVDNALINAAQRKIQQAAGHLLSLQHSDGHWLWVRAKGQAYRSSRAEAGRLVGIVLDISDQKQADERVDVACSC